MKSILTSLDFKINNSCYMNLVILKTSPFEKSAKSKSDKLWNMTVEQWSSFEIYGIAGQSTQGAKDAD